MSTRRRRGGRGRSKPFIIQSRPEVYTLYTPVQPPMPPAATRAEIPSLARRLAERGILISAIAVFTKKGAGATRVEDILESAGVARRTFYKYFRGKDDVLAGLYEL